MGALGPALALGWSAGIAAGQLMALSGVAVVLAACAVAGAVALAPSGRLRLLAATVLAIVAGIGRVALASSDAGVDVLAGLTGDVVVVGRVLDAPVQRGTRLDLDVEVESVMPTSPGAVPRSFDSDRPRVLVRAARATAGYGDRVEARGRLVAPRSRPGWPLAEILARRRIFWVLDTGFVRTRGLAESGFFTWLMWVHDAADANIRLWLPEPTGSLVAGMVLGARTGLPSDLRARLAATGTTHLVAVSGFNVAVVAGGLMVVSRWLGGRRFSIVPTLAGVWLYTLLVGAPPSALRAAAMLSVALAAQAAGRVADPIVGLVLAVAVLLGYDPTLAFDLGFQLSVAATAGLIVLSPALSDLMPRLPGWLRESVAVALAAQLATLPILLGTFQTVSLVALPTNLIVIPLVSPLTWLGVLLALAAPLPGLGVVLGWAAWLPATGLFSIIDWFAGLPDAAIATGRPASAFAVCWYAMLLCWVGARSADVRAIGLRPRPLYGAMGALALAALTLAFVPAGRSGALEISLLDVEAGAAFVRAPSGQTAVLLTADDAFGLTPSVAQRLRGLGDVPSVIVAPAGASAVADLVRRYPAETVLEADAAQEGVRPGTRVTLDDGTTIEVVDVRSVDDRTVLDLAVRAAGLTVWLPGPGRPDTNWASLIGQDRAVLRLPSTATSWLREGPPQPWSLLVGQGARVQAADLAGRQIVDQRRSGAVELVLTDGMLDVRSERCDSGDGCPIEFP
jgi:competence protein ComEC